MLFDRSWYNRAGVEKVMGFCTPQEYDLFLQQTPIFEQMLIDDGILLRKYWFSVSDSEQLRRFKSRHRDPVRRWKLSPMDLESINRWEDYSRAKDEMMAHTDTATSPWFVVESDVKKHARLNMIAHLLASIPYTEVPAPEVELPKRLTASSDYQRPPRETVHLRTRLRIHLAGRSGALEPISDPRLRLPFPSGDGRCGSVRPIKHTFPISRPADAASQAPRYRRHVRIRFEVDV